MRKLLCLVFAGLTVFGLASDASAVHFASAYDLFCYWEEYGYPSCVCSVSSTDGTADRLTVVLAADTPKNRMLIRSMLQTPEAITFAAGSGYSHNELVEIQHVIAQELLDGDEWLRSCSVGWGTANGSVTGFGESRREDRVIVGVDSVMAQEYAERYHFLYGDAVVVQDTLGAVITAADTAARQHRETVSSLTSITLGSLALLSAAALLRRQHKA